MRPTCLSPLQQVCIVVNADKATVFSAEILTNGIGGLQMLCSQS